MGFVQDDQVQGVVAEGSANADYHVPVLLVDADVLKWHLSFKATNPRLLYPG